MATSILLASITISLLLPLALAVDFNYPAVFNFGDSSCDTGNRIASGLDYIALPYGETFFNKPSGRFSDGRLIIDFLVEAMGLPFLNPYLDSIGAPSFQRGCNFAVAGSEILPATATSFSPFSFGIQVTQFLRFKDRVIELLNKDNQFKEYIPQADFFTQGLYMFDIGQNDLTFGIFFKPDAQVIASIPAMLLEFENGLKKLYDQGARRFWIHNTGPLGCLPQNMAYFGKDPTKLDELGCVRSHDSIAKMFNLQLHALYTKLQAELVGANITFVDIFSIKSDLIANYSRYGFDQPITACCGYGGPPLNYDIRITCGQTKNLDGNIVTSKGCNDTTKNINWDGIHCTEAANAHIASQILSGKYSEPPFPDKMPFLLKLKI